MSGVPGLAVAIVENDQVVLSAGFGIRKLGALGRVTPDTIFPIASCGKAITAAGLATLVDAGEIGWDDKVIDHLRWRDRGTEPAYVTFALTAEGTIEKITMKAVSPFADFSFDYHDLLLTPVAATTKDTL